MRCKPPINLRSEPAKKSGPPQVHVVGDRHGKLTLIEMAGRDDHSYIWWRCRCDCGVEKLVRGSSLNRTTSCGCERRKPWSKQTWEVEFRNAQAQRYKRHKCGTPWPWSLTLEEFKDIVGKPCHYCGGAPSMKTKVGGLVRSGIDRIDSLVGYEAGNCVPCCATCNLMKGTRTVDEFITQLRRILNHIVLKVPDLENG
jgi:hypothetical protein